jgi:hypothetical protein
MASKNKEGKTREVELPYAIFKMGDWEWRVLKRYQNMENEAKNQYAIWFCAVRSPLTYNSWEYGDTYVNDIPGAVPGMQLTNDVVGEGEVQNG